MKTILIPCILIACHSHGQVAATDSVPARELNEMTVVADNQYAERDRSVYIPDNRQRSAASDGVSLLALMNISRLDVNTHSGSVRTIDNQGVSLFINFHEASEEDIAGLNPQNVKRIEYLDFPADPRFLRAQHVVNFITREPAYGGYTKLTAKERILVRSGEASVYSKFSHRLMEYDVMVNGVHDNNSNIGNQTAETYRLHDRTVERVSDVTSVKHRENNLFAGLRVSWNKSQDFTFRNLVSIRRNHVPVKNTAGQVKLSPGEEAHSYSSDNNATYLGWGWESDLYASLGSGWSLNGNIQTEFNDNRIHSAYTTAGTAIINNADEKSLYARFNAQINKIINDRISLFTNLTAGAGETKITYSGNDAAHNRFNPAFGGASLGAAITLNNMSGSVDAGFARESNAINGSTINDSYPFTHVSLQYSPDRNNSIGAWFQYAAFSPDASMKNPNIIQQNEVLYITGNPALRCSKHITANINYTFLPGNRWQLSAYATMFRIMNRQIPVYTPDGPGGMMLKKYFNDGDYNHGQIGARISGKFMNGKIAASVAPRLLLYHITGTNSISYYPFGMSANVDYYAGAFFFNIYWQSSNRYVDGETCYLRKMPGEYSLSAGWSGKGWHIQMTVANIFRSSWEISDDTLITNRLDSKIIQSGADFHRRISLSVSYTLNYGRKVNMSDELMDSGGGNSSILR